MVKIYTTENCVACKMTKKWLKKNDILFSEIVVGDDDYGLQTWLISQGNRSFPVVFSGEKSWSGYNIDHLRSLL